MTALVIIIGVVAIVAVTILRVLVKPANDVAEHFYPFEQCPVHLTNWNIDIEESPSSPGVKRAILRTNQDQPTSSKTQSQTAER